MSNNGTMSMYKLTPPVLTDGAQIQLMVDANGNLKVAPAANAGVGGLYPSGAVILTSASGNKANAVATATLTGTATTTVYINGFEVTGSGATTGLPVTVTITGILGGTLSYTYTFVAGVLLPNTQLNIQFTQPLPASAVNTAIVVSCPASGAGGTNNAVVAHGFYI